MLSNICNLELSMASKKNTTYTYNQVLEKCLHYFDGDELAATTWMGKYAIKTTDDRFLELTPDAMHRRMAKEFMRIEKKHRPSPPDSYRDLTKGKRANRNFRNKKLSEYGKQRAPLTEEKIFEYFKNFKYIIPQGSVMASLGNSSVIASYSNCVVLPEICDSYGGILYTDHQLAQLFKRRCGVGIDLSSLRPEGVSVSNAARTTSGAVSFMERYSNTTREVAQKGRRGALMITMDIAHPDIEKFITSKQDLSKVTGANISVRLSDEFMHAVEKNKPFTLRWPIDAKVTGTKDDGRGIFSKKVNATNIWNTIVRCAHNTAEPGLIFWDKQHLYSTSSIYPNYKNISTNPCSEIAMQGGDSCRLMAINLFSLVDEPFTSNATFNYKKFFEVVYEAQRLMDNLVDLELEAIERILKKVKADPEPDNIKQVEKETWELLHKTGKKGRRTGLGFTALADALAALGHKYDSTNALIEIEKIMKVKCEAEFESSIDLAIERGKFADFNTRYENKSEFVLMLKKQFPHVYKRMMKYGRRNISISTVAPTGSLSILTQTSSGLEPVYMLSYKRRRKINSHDTSARVDFVDVLGDSWQEFDVYHAKIKTWMKVSGSDDISRSPYIGSTAPEIDWMKRLEVQAIIQKYVTHSISSTINLPATVTPEQVGNIYVEAWKKGLKGVTVYRDGSRSGVLIKDEKKSNDATPTSSVTTSPLLLEAPKRPQILEAEVIRFMNHDERWVAVVGLLNGKPYEIFTGKDDKEFHLPYTIDRGWVVKVSTKDSSRYDFQYLYKNDPNGYKNKQTVEGLSRSFNQEYWNYAKLISGVLRQGMPLTQVVELVENLKLYDNNINTWTSGVSRALKRYIEDGAIPGTRKCPSCGDIDGLIYEEGCLHCKSCGYSAC